MESLHIRAAVPSDAPALLALYAPYVEHTAITFEYEVPTPAEFEERIRHTLTHYPYLVAEENGTLLGYAYAGAFKSRAAYDWAVETTIYLREGVSGRGIGRKLYEALERALAAQGIRNLNACIAVPGENDPYLTDGSPRFHEHMGYSLVGRFHQCGYKFDRWYDMIWMEKAIGDHPAHPAPVIPFSQIQFSEQ